MAEKQKFTQKHETLWQLMKFFVFSLCASVAEVISYAVLKNTLSQRLTEDFDFFVFHYTSKQDLNKGLFIAFLASAIIAEIVSFLINRKATFNANNNIVKSAIMYFILVIFVICLKTWMITVLTPVISGVTQSEFLIEWVPKIASMALSFAIIFPLNKFVIMKHTD